MSEPTQPAQPTSQTPEASKPWWKRWWGVTLIALALLVLLMAVFSDPEEVTDLVDDEPTVTQDAPDDEDEEAAEPGPEQEPVPDEPAPEAAPAFHPDQARVVLPLQAPGFTRVEVHFVHEDGDVEDASVACVDHYLQQYDSVFCYGFASEDDFQFAEVDEDAGGMQRLCWTARADKANPDAERSSQGGGPFDPDCPSASG